MQAAETSSSDLRSSNNLKTWKDLLGDERKEPYFTQLLAFLEAEKQRGKIIFPPTKNIFNAFTLTPFDKVRVVIVGQDPYHAPGQAHGLCFSVQAGVRPPPSLENIFKELRADLGISHPNHGCLESWAKQGVLLLNTSLTVEQGKPGSHSKIGWERFTDTVITALNNNTSGLVFILWGAHAQKKCENINQRRHHLLIAPHPSPFSANRGFFGCRHFSKTNELLTHQGHPPIEWRIPDI